MIRGLSQRLAIIGTLRGHESEIWPL